MTGHDRSALLLAARLLESGVSLDEPALVDQGGHVNVGIALAERLRRVADCPERAREIVASLRSAASSPTGTPTASH